MTWRRQPLLAAVVQRAAAWVFALTGSPAAARIGGVPTEDLISRFQRGQPLAFEALYDRYKDYAYRIAFSALRNREEAEDAVQEIFLDLLKALPDYDVHGPARFETWLYRVALNRARMRMRRKTLPSAEWEDMEEGLERLPMPDSERPERAVIDRESAAALWRAVDQLPDTHRQPVLMRYRDGMAYEEIASVLGVRLGTVKNHNLGEIYRGAAHEAFRERKSPPPACDGCEVISKCNGGCPLYRVDGLDTNCAAHRLVFQA